MLTPVYLLLVEDDEGEAELAKVALEGAGIRVVHAPSVTEARKLLSVGSYEILIVDMRLPDGEGLDLLAVAKERDPHVVGIVMTGFASTEAAVSALRRGAYDFLTKPCKPEALVASVHRAAERHRLTRALEQRSLQLEELNRELDRRVQDNTRQIFFLNERLKRFIVQLMKAGEDRIKFLDNVTHELKNPLSVIWGHVAHLLGRDLKEVTADEFEFSLKAIHRNAEALNAMLEELMDSARISGHKMRLRRESLRASDQVREIVDGFQPQAMGKGIGLTADCPAGPGPEFSGDRLRLRQVLSNLITNALKFTPAGGRIVVKAAPSGTSVHFTVSDTGPGISSDALDRVFDRFFQEESGQPHKGLGLGLEISKGIVTLHGGTIWVESELGQGARFHFTIPCEAPTGDPEPEGPRSTAAHA
jgi:signal transduction histidine kinase